MDLWLPGARTLPGASPGLTMNSANGIRRCTWHCTWDRLDPRPSFDNVATYLVKMGYEPTLMWNPETGDFIQFFPADRGGYALEHKGTETNRQGVIHVQVEVYFSPGVNGWQRFTDSPMIGADQLMAWLDQLGIPRTGPLVDGDYSRNVTRWLNESGHFGHVNAPGNTHTDPAYPPDMARLFAATGEDDMPLSDTDKAWIMDLLKGNGINGAADPKFNGNAAVMERLAAIEKKLAGVPSPTGDVQVSGTLRFE